MATSWKENKNFLMAISLSVTGVAHILFHVGSVCLSVGLTALGIMCWFAPSLAAEQYGIEPCRLPSGIRSEWVQVAGLRDLGLGLATLGLYLYEPRAIRIFVPAITCIPAGDALLALQHGTATAHGSGCARVWHRGPLHPFRQRMAGPIAAPKARIEILAEHAVVSTARPGGLRVRGICVRRAVNRI